MSHRIFGAELSPYSVKVRSYFRYKRIPHEWVVRGPDTEDEFQRYARLPLVPLVVTPDGAGLQDSTPIIERLEAEHPTPALQPADPVLAFVSALIEEYADEWGNKQMFHYRWFYEPDQLATAARLAAIMMPGADGDALQSVIEAIRERMVARLRFVGSSAATKGQIERSFTRTLGILEVHLASRPYLFGGRPAFGDFGLAAQLYECATDPTAGGLIRANAPRVLAWTERMLDPRADGAFETWERLAPTLTPLLRDEIGSVFLPWTVANATALAAGDTTFTATLEGVAFCQDTQKYHAKSLGVLRGRYAKVAGTPALDAILREAGCLPYLR